MNYELHLGDNREVLRSMPSDSVDSIVCDPPYELGFMGKRWDSTGIAYDVTLWAECLRVLKPGGHLLAFGGSRTYHRLAVAIEDAGFEIRDCIMWLYGSGFPKSHDVSKALDKQAGAEREVITEKREDMFGEYEVDMSYKAATQSGVTKGLNASNANEYGHTFVTLTAPATPLAQQWQGWGTALKPAHEPIVVARKPLQGTVADNVQAWGVGALNIDGCRVDANWQNDINYRVNGKVNCNDNLVYQKYNKITTYQTTGRWPANIIFDEEAAQMLDEQSGVSGSSNHNRHNTGAPSVAKGKEYSRISIGHSDSGGASRFFYVAKASKAEREAGLEGMAVKDAQSTKWSGEGMPLRQNGTERKMPRRANHHPTVKPIALMRYLVRMVTPRDGVVLDPFMGSGTTGCAAMLEGMNFIGIDITPEYKDIAERRIQYWASQNPMNL